MNISRCYNYCMYPARHMKLQIIEPKDSERLGIPYEDGVGSRGEFRYTDSRQRPDLIREIPEIAKHKSLIEFVQTLNSSWSLFRTLRSEAFCECNILNELNENEFQAHWQFTFAFEILDFNVGGHDVFQELLIQCAQTLWFENKVLISSQKIPTYYRDHKLYAFCQDVTLYGIGDTAAVALAGFNEGLCFLKLLFESESIKHSSELKGGKVTVS